MIPVVTPTQMRSVDDAASDPLDVLIARAAGAVARHAISMLGGTYGRTVNVIAGKGNNGADGRGAADRLRARGLKVRVFDAEALPAEFPAADLLIDAAYGTGFGADRTWDPPEVGTMPVLAVDIPSGIDGLTGVAASGVIPATETITFQALKPGLLFGSGPALSGVVTVVDIGLDADVSGCHLVDASDVASWWPRRSTGAHKWNGAVKVLAGSESMPGAAELCTASALRGGSGLVSLASPGARPRTRSEIMQQPIAATGFIDAVLGDLDRFSAFVIGPGLGRDPALLDDVRLCVEQAGVPVVIDGDAITAVASRFPGRTAPTVITPHDGEFATLTGLRPGPDRVEVTRQVAKLLNSTILLKGPTTVVASPDGAVLLVDHGDQRLATAGTGDVLAGLIGAGLANGCAPLQAAAAAAWIHADAARRCSAGGMLAGDIVERLPETIAALR